MVLGVAWWGFHLALPHCSCCDADGFEGGVLISEEGGGIIRRLPGGCSGLWDGWGSADLVVIGFGLAYSFFSLSVCHLLPRLSPGWAWGFVWGCRFFSLGLCGGGHLGRLGGRVGTFLVY
jgi:hypothetical protein